MFIKIIFSSLLLISLLGITFNRYNIIILLMCLELIFISLSTLFALNTTYIVVSIIILAIAACETALILSLIVSFYKIKGNIGIKSLNILRG
mgnify:CR=1 FL=1|tara:strand:+ start:522 stop:797 length:276 start_codon:yes stop_codon:yes gene_type:complete